MPKTSTTWKPGQSGNPGGRPRIAKEIRAEAQADSPEAYAVIKEIMLKGDKDAARLAAAVKVLQIAGIAMSEDKSPDPPAPTPSANVTPEDLEAAATQGEA